MSHKEHIEFEKVKQELLEDRKKNFSVKIELNKFGLHSGEILLSVKVHEDHWNSISLLPDEIDAVIAALQQHKKKSK